VYSRITLTFSKYLQWRKTVKELLDEFESKGADTVYAFQTRNPTHSGHAYLMRSAGEDLRAKGFKKPVLWLSPLGGWTKSDDVPLDVRVKQHEQVLEAGYVVVVVGTMAVRLLNVRSFSQYFL
jgi:3'-phosphoadenosine 5'-phosphosulfate synthase